MNSAQRRKFRRYIEKNLYKMITDGVEVGRTGCYEYDLYPSKAKLYIDFPNKGDYDQNYVYVSVPSFHLINPVKVMGYKHSLGVENINSYKFMFDISEAPDTLRSIKCLEELTPFRDSKGSEIDLGIFPQFALKSDKSYLFFSEQGKINIRRRMENDDGSYTLKKVEFNEIFEGELVSKEVKKQLAFHIDLFKGTKNE